MCASIDTKFDVKWPYTCYICNNPIDMKILPRTPSTEFFKRLLTYRLMYPFDFIHNKSIYKVFGLKARRVCMVCFANETHKVHPKRIALREISGNKIVPNMRSKTVDELFNWFESFNKFVNRPDVQDYVDGPITYISPLCLLLSDVLYRSTVHRELEEQQQ